MNGAGNNIYKVISLCLKTLIVLASCWYIYTKVFHRPDRSSLAELLAASRSAAGMALLFAVLLLMLLNWLLEARKWKVLLSVLGPARFSEALKGVLCGLAFSIITPNRAGEFAGKVLLLEKSRRWKGAFLSFAGSAVQLSVTILVPAITFFFTRDRWEGDLALSMKALALIAAFSGALVLALFFLLLLLLDKEPVGNGKWPEFLRTLRETGWRRMSAVAGLSFLRYTVFSLQFGLLLHLFGANVEAGDALVLIPLTFFAIAIVPTFALTEIGVRGAAAMVIFSSVTLDNVAVVAASLALWIINVALPALAGCFFIYRLKFFPGKE